MLAVKSKFSAFETKLSIFDILVYLVFDADCLGGRIFSTTIYLFRVVCSAVTRDDIESISFSIHQIDGDIPATASHTAAGEDASAPHSALLQVMMRVKTVMVMIL